MIKKYETSYLFIGPSSHGITPDIPRNMKVMPPARRGDIESLIANSPPATIVLVDGTYHSYPAVSHAEIRQAINDGWTIWGLSSMGAIRATELAPVGMKGYGKVFSMFAGNEDLPDDYVALIHGNEPPYTPVSEPLVHIDFFLKELATEKLISDKIHFQLLEYFSNMWFGYRKINTLKKLLKDHVENSSYELIEHKLRNFQLYRIKSQDVQSFLANCEH